MSWESYGDKKNFNYMLQIDILRNSSKILLVVLSGGFLVVGCPKRHPGALLAKTMIHTLGSYDSTSGRKIR